MQNDKKKMDKPVKPPKKSDFTGTQLDLFQSFLCNNDKEQDCLSNTFDLWDSVPRYSVSRQAMDKMRKTDTFPQLLNIPFNYRGRELKAVIRPAWMENGTEKPIGYYPSANEELVEDALRKIASEHNKGFFDKTKQRGGVAFTLYMLSEELKKRGHTRSDQEIVLSLRILAYSSIEIITTDKQDGEAFGISSYFSGLSAVSRKKIADDPEAKWLVQFHPLVAQAIDSITYRQFNYAKMMSHSSQLTRWLHKLLSLKFIYASLSTSFDIRYSTIKRDSALLEGYNRERNAVIKLNEALEELKASGMLMKIEKKEIVGKRGKLEDIVYTLTASMSFISEMKSANKRQTINIEASKNVDNSEK